MQMTSSIHAFNGQIGFIIITYKIQCVAVVHRVFTVQAIANLLLCVSSMIGECVCGNFTPAKKILRACVYIFVSYVLLLLLLLVLLPLLSRYYAYSALGNRHYFQ